MMYKDEYILLLEERASGMRKHMTPQEGKLWYLFLKSYPVHFRRQVVIGKYIVDFFCKQAELAIEIDGSQHYAPLQKMYDARRTAYIEAGRIQVLRLSNRDIDRDIENVKLLIHEIVQSRLRR